MTSFRLLGYTTPFELTYTSPVNDEIYKRTPLPNVVIGIIVEYADAKPIVGKVTLTKGETAAKIGMCIMTLGLWKVYQTHRYKKVLINEGYSSEDAIKAIKRGADPTCFAVHFGKASCLSQRDVIESIKPSKQFEFAVAQLTHDEKKNLYFRGIRSLEKWAIISKYTNGDKLFEERVLQRAIDCYQLYDPMDSRRLLEILDKFGDIFYSKDFDNDHKKRAIDIFTRRKDFESLGKVLEKLNEGTRTYFCMDLFGEDLLLLFNNSGLTVKDTFLKIAIRMKHKEDVELLARHHPRPFKAAILLNNLEAVQSMLSIGLEPHQEDISLAKDSNLEIYRLIVSGQRKVESKREEADEKESHSIQSIQSLNLDEDSNPSIYILSMQSLSATESNRKEEDEEESQAITTQSIQSLAADESDTEPLLPTRVQSNSTVIDIDDNSNLS